MPQLRSANTTVGWSASFAKSPCVAAIVCLVALTAVLGSATAARAQARETFGDELTLDQAKARFKDGNALLAAGKHEAALEQFLASRALVPSVQNTINAAVCLNQLGRLDEALDLYEEALSKFAGELTPELLSTLGPTIADLRERTSRIQVEANVAGALAIDDKSHGNLPLPGPVRVMPGAHTVRVTKPGYAPFEASVKVAAGATASVRATLEPPRKRAPAPAIESASTMKSAENESVDVDVDDHEPGNGSTQRTLAFVAGGLGVVGVGIGTYFGLRAMSKKDDYEKHQDSDGACLDMACETLSGEASSAGNASTIAFVAGGALLATGVVLYFTAAGNGDETRAAVRIGAMAGARGVRGALEGRW